MSQRDYAILWVGATKANGGAIASGGSVLLTTPRHKLDGPEHQVADDTTNLDATVDAHGLLPKLSGDAADSLLGDGTWGPPTLTESDPIASALVAAHLADTTDAHDASAISFVPTGTIASTNVQDAIAEVASEAGTTIPAGTYELAIEGGQSVIKAHGSMGSTETFDPTDGNVHTGTLNANCTFTLSAPSGSGACTLELRLTQDATGGRTITWPGSVTVLGTLVTTASTQAIVILETLDGGTSWVAVVVGGSSGSSLTVKDEGGSLATAATSIDFVGPLVTASGTGAAKTVTVTGVIDDLADVTITSAAAAQRLRYNGSAWVNSDLIWRPTMVLDPTSGNYLPVTSSGDAVMVEA